MSDRTVTDLKVPFTVTYAELRDKYLSSTKDSLKGNAKSAMKYWLKGIGKSTGDVVGPELIDDSIFLKEVDKHIASYKKTLSKRPNNKKAAKSTIWNRTLALNGMRDFYFTLGEESTNNDDSFGQTLKALIKDSKLSYGKVAAKIGITIPTLSKWLNESSLPSAANKETVRLLEETFGVSEGTLSNKIKYWFGSVALDNMSFVQNPHRKHQGRLTKSLYTLRPLPAKLYKVFNEIIDHKKKESIIDANGNIHDQPGLWLSDATIKIALTAFERFFGFLHLPKTDPAAPQPNASKEERGLYVERRGLGMPIKKLHCALLTDAELINHFFDFLTKRTVDGRKNSGHSSLLGHFISLMQQGYGYFRANPKFGAKLCKPIVDKNPKKLKTKWDKWLDSNLNTMRALQRSISSKTRKDNHRSRKPEEPMQDLLALRKGIYDELVESVKKAIAELPRAYPSLCAPRCRDVILAILLIEEPLRQKHFRLMELGRHLVKREDGTWWCIWDAQIFKNPQTNKMGRQTEIPSQWYPIIEEYLQDWRPQLAGAKETSFVIRVRRDPKRKQDSLRPVETSYMHNIVYCFTKKYLKKVSAIGPHAFRDLAVTDYLSKFPNDWAGAAALVGDSESTIRKHYSHLEQKDHLDRAMKNRRNSKSDGTTA